MSVGCSRYDASLCRIEIDYGISFDIDVGCEYQVTKRDLVWNEYLKKGNH